MRAYWARFLAAILGMMTLPAALACSCSQVVSGPACQLISIMPVAFLGTVTGIEPDPLMPEAPSAHLYRFRVESVYKGLNPRTTSVLVNPDNFTNCQTEYRVAERYVIFGTRSPGPAPVVMTGACSGSRLASDHQGDVRFLERYRDGKSITTISGHVVQAVELFGRPDPDSLGTVPKALVTLESNSFKQVLTAGSSGEFTFAPPKPGSYRLTVESEGFERTSRSLEVASGGCTETFPMLSSRTLISGRVTAADGQPLSHTRIELLRRGDSGKWHSTGDYSTQSGTDGSFEFTNLPTGDYLLGHEIWHERPSQYSPYPANYFPGVHQREKASVLGLVAGQRREGLVLRLGPKQTERRIHVEVVWPDGSSPTENSLQLFAGSDLLENLGPSIRGQISRHRGIFDFVGYEERSYTLNARYWVDDLGSDVPHDQRRISLTNQVELEPGKGPARVRLVLGPVRRIEE